ncbi:2-desacetyl-2-hydroxyethyl bacteriochlorophyllide A dehydrogenase [Micromonospora purpureochromogenes]|uniref:2-desacetyl-2-hydroxyethyl bacteriochlorophyllide A dehydrogenase n=1 Tax=Micromonospora purpureochromogenes TaxID=47872 RepID=A0A1C4Z3W9_9ACTN|nr:zinc-binding dehydrogenase [Micromonospora purpureochromogenes]SCF27623.1 2-desacetyl-2-hydroxyethyl bacteriochlorophyllide A dehydrogenase [Micromonospora purpureochromogenes]
MGNWVVSLAGPRRVSLEPCPTDPLGPGQVRVRTCYSGISAGTELTLFRGSNPRLSKDWDDTSRMFVPRQTPVPYPLVGFGYEEVGEIVEVADDVADRHPGQLVWGIWGHRAEAVLPAGAVNPLAPGLDPLAAVFARPGAIALTAVLAGDLHLGDWVGIFGQGVIGLLATRLASLSGARVVAVDQVPARLERAARLGARRTVDAGVDSAAAVLREATAGRGADVCLELSGAYPALHEAIRATTHAGRVVAGGFYQGQADGLGLGEEFHHNRIQLVAAQVSGPAPAPGLAGRWSGTRIAHTFMDLVAEGSVDPLPLVSHVVDARAVADALALLDHGAGDVLQVVLEF